MYLIFKGDLNDSPLNPDAILQLGLGFWASKALLSGVELGLFTALAKSPLDAHTLADDLGLHPRSALDFFDALVALHVLERNGDLYSNTAEADLFLDREKPTYIGGVLEMANERLYPFWGSLTEALRTGKPQNEAKQGGNFFAALYADEGRLRSFLKGMTGLSLGAAIAMAQKFPWGQYRTFMDVGTAQGGVPVQIALVHSHLTGGGFDLPVVRPIFEEYVNSRPGDRLRFIPRLFQRPST